MNEGSSVLQCVISPSPRTSRVCAVQFVREREREEALTHQLKWRAAASTRYK